MTFLQRLEHIEPYLAQFHPDFQSLKRLVQLQDTPALLNKIRYITERILYTLCKQHEISWGKGEPRMDRMLGPLRAAKILPAPIFAHFRTIQNLSNPGSHFQEDQLNDSHTEIAQLALLEVLEWYAQQLQSIPIQYTKRPNLLVKKTKNNTKLLFLSLFLILGGAVLWLWGGSGQPSLTDNKRNRATDLIQQYSQNTSERHFKMVQLSQIIRSSSSEQLFEEEWNKYRNILERYNMNRGVYRIDIKYILGDEMFLWEREIHMELLYAGRNLECLHKDKGDRKQLLQNLEEHLDNANGGYQQFKLTANQMIDGELAYPLPVTKTKEPLDQELARPCTQ